MEASHRLEDIFWTTPLKNMETFPIAEEVIQKKITEIANVASNFYISYKTKWLVAHPEGSRFITWYINRSFSLNLSRIHDTDRKQRCKRKCLLYIFYNLSTY